MPKYKINNIEVEIVQWTGENIEEIKTFCPLYPIPANINTTEKCIFVGPPGIMRVDPPDYIMKMNDNFFAISPDIFEYVLKDQEAIAPAAQIPPAHDNK